MGILFGALILLISFENIGWNKPLAKFTSIDVFLLTMTIYIEIMLATNFISCEKGEDK